ncbi:39S ribosomal protein L37, mitochondrial [Saguinus oedipus]|uniref:Large ribosomal subunit protein mL37 n=1 Tax=Saguinus oedipus TaxID=9490 RepID=A0ABQ9VG74_SAGOE|nr:39S ribosomal protein L37, mitochondrial [Saguinus oedipus]
MALASGPARLALAGSGQLGLGGFGAPRRRAYEWGVRSTQKKEPPPLDRVYEIPGLEPITYAGKMHFVPWLVRPIFPPWDRGWRHPQFYRSPPLHEHPLYKDQPCYIFHHQRFCVKQALWLTKTKLIEGLPEKVLSLVADPGNHVENQDERVLSVISHARLWHCTEEIPKRETYCPVIVDSLIQLCKSQILKHPSLARRICAQNSMSSASWNRDLASADTPQEAILKVFFQAHFVWWQHVISCGDLCEGCLCTLTMAGLLMKSLLLQVRGFIETQLNTKDRLPTIASREEVEATKNHVLETFYPISPTIDLHECNVYDVKDHTGFREGYPYPYPHTLYLLDKANLRPRRFQPDQLRAKMILFAFGSALAQARLLYGNDAKVLEQPVVVQSVGTDGRVFHFLVFQLNTTDLASNEGVKNLAWVDSDQLLYQHFWCLPVIKKRVVVGLSTGSCRALAWPQAVKTVGEQEPVVFQRTAPEEGQTNLHQGHLCCEDNCRAAEGP